MIRRSFWPTNRLARSIPNSSEQVFQILRDLVDQRGKTVVAVTHDLDLARRMDRRIVLQDGRIVSDES
jgi:lipoprotein-releasing system ATP-binding protein